ncbi:beta-ketoacyl synthase N-terminal-like domain-containing protein [Streptomyces sp. NPDC003032]
MLEQGRDLVIEAPPERFESDRFLDRRGRPGKTRTTAGGFLENIADFDADFFIGVSGQDYLDLQAARTGTVNPYTMTGGKRGCHRQPHLLRAGLARRERGSGHRLLLGADRGPPGL